MITVVSQVLDLSFNDFKGPGFEPLENCKALQVRVSRFILISPKAINDEMLYRFMQYGSEELYYSCSNSTSLETKSHHLQAFPSFLIWR